MRTRFQTYLSDLRRLRAGALDVGHGFSLGSSRTLATSRALELFRVASRFLDRGRQGVVIPQSRVKVVEI